MQNRQDMADQKTPQATAQELKLTARLPDGRLWPCAVRFSPRARRLRLRVDAQGAATLVAPSVRTGRATPPEKLQDVLDSLSPWLAKTLTRLVGPDAAPPDTASPPPPELPASISLPLCGMVWHVYVVDRPGRVTLRQEVLGAVLHDSARGGHADSRNDEDSLHDSRCDCCGADGLRAAAGGRIILSGPVQDADFAAACCALLQRWLRRQAGTWLEQRLRLLAARMGVDVGRVTVRAQRGRWGSCSSRGDISLNCLLLLLPLPLLDHVCVHELCHRRHMDHSRRYRAHLARHAPHWELRERALDRAWRQMPAWALWRPAR